MRKGTNRTFHSTARDTCVPSEGDLVVAGSGVIGLAILPYRRVRFTITAIFSASFQNIFIMCDTGRARMQPLELK